MSKYFELIKKVKINYSLQACSFMTIGLCFHFLSYECSRAASITLLAAKVKINE